ncbi:hypothetical protein HMPREF3039_02377 [Akkermansia sp. KLE1798]|nr:hypothetical protein HMPREF3039_02377 [Akkermansia sp. KLE1798]
MPHPDNRCLHVVRIYNKMTTTIRPATFLKPHRSLCCPPRKKAFPNKKRCGTVSLVPQRPCKQISGSFT